MGKENLILNEENGVRINTNANTNANTNTNTNTNIKKDILLEELLHFKNKFQVHIKDMKIFNQKAKKHVNYLTILMFFSMIYLNEIKFLNNSQFLFVLFVVMFHITFTKNMLLNVPHIKTREE